MKKISVFLLALLLLMLSSCSMARIFTKIVLAPNGLKESVSTDTEAPFSKEESTTEEAPTETQAKAPADTQPQVPKPEEKPIFEFTKLSDGTYEITKYTGKAKEVEIPFTYQGINITKIGEKAFAFHGELEKVTFADGCKITTFEKYAFGACYSLKYVEIPPSVVLMKAAFVDCTAMEKVDIVYCANWKVYLSKETDCEYLSLTCNEEVVYFLTSPYGFDIYTWKYEE